MHVACKCLNVSIKARGNELQPVNIDDYELTAAEVADPFFREVCHSFIQYLPLDNSPPIGIPLELSRASMLSEQRRKSSSPNPPCVYQYKVSFIYFTDICQGA